MGKLRFGACALLLFVSEAASAALLSNAEAMGAGNASPVASPDPFEIDASDDGAPVFQDRLADLQEFPFSPPGNADSVPASLGSLMLDVDPALANNVLSGSKYETADDSSAKPAARALCGISLVALTAFRAAFRFSGKRRRRRR
jgi:hypothetical protein